MSTHWDIVCLDCNAEAGFHWNHGVDQLRAIRAAAAEIAAARPMFDAVDVTEFRIGFAESGGYSDVVRWFDKHLSHRLAVKNEYGEIDGACGKRVSCGGCSSVFCCVRPSGHDGPCGK